MWLQNGSSLAPELLGRLAHLGSSSSAKRNGLQLQPSGSPGVLLFKKCQHVDLTIAISELFY